MVCREEKGKFVQKPSYMASMKIIAGVQNKIDGWEVRYNVYVLALFQDSLLDRMRIKQRVEYFIM